MNALVTDEHIKFAESIRWRTIREMAQGIANRDQRRDRIVAARARLEQHTLECKSNDGMCARIKHPCLTRKELELELELADAEAGQ